MTDKPTEEEIQAFDRLVPRAAELHTYTLCVRSGLTVFTWSLKGQECLRCRHFVGNDGICDPL